MGHSNKETLSIAWCDNGMVDGRFADAITQIILTAPSLGINIKSKFRVHGNQIGRQRQVLFDAWADNSDTDWLLWIDSDIVLTKEALSLVWNSADKISRPIVTGVYFISSDPEGTLMKPQPSIFYEGLDGNQLFTVEPLPENKLIKIDYAGFGFVLMHRSIIKELQKVSPDYSIFAEEQKVGNQFVSEDIVFFKNLKKANIPLYAHTGAHVQHMKRFSLDINYYNLYWNYFGKKEGEF